MGFSCQCGQSCFCLFCKQRSWGGARAWERCDHKPVLLQYWEFWLLLLLQKSGAALARLPREWWGQCPWRCSTTLEMWHWGDVVSGHGVDGLELGLVISEVISNLSDSIRTSSWQPTRRWGQHCLQCWILHWVGRVSEQLHLCASHVHPAVPSTCQSPSAPQCSCLAGSCAWLSLHCVSCSEGEKAGAAPACLNNFPLKEATYQ